VKIAISSQESISTDPEVLSLVLRSVLENALRFSPPSSTVDVLLEHVGDVIEILIRDRGPGMSAEFASRAFEPFTQADSSLSREHGGLGIGLYAARKLAKEIDSQVEVSKTSPDGTEIVIRIPN
jgi:signal transduction histidine kinase